MSSYLIYKDILFFLIKNLSKITFLLILILGTLITISSNSWISSWLGLEINLIAFISLILNNKKILSIESSLIYFLTQAIASSILLYAIIFYIMNIKLQNFIINNFNNLIIIALIIKIGAAPTHFWIPLVIRGLSWINNYILITWQKIAPIILLIYCANKNLFIIFILISTIIGSIIGFNQTSVKKIIAYSSINYNSWILVSIQINLTLWKLFIRFYFYLSGCLIIIFHLINILIVNQFFSINKKNFKINIVLIINILSIGGLPPIIGFFPKIIVIINIIIFKKSLIIIIILSFNLITLFYYLRITYSTFLINFIKNNSLLNNQFNFIKSKIKYLLINFIVILSYFSNLLLIFFVIINILL